MVKKNKQVVALGGGSVVAKRNRNAIKDHGVVVYLKVDAKNLCQRVKSKKLPLLQEQSPLECF